jgi:phospho-N-acetylmuramoyl-pentapeptide-transferase
MLAWLAEFSATFNVLNLFRYIVFRSGGAWATVLCFVLVLGPAISGWLMRWRRSHLAARGEPLQFAHAELSMLVGIVVLAGIILSTLLWANLRNPYVWIVLLVAVALGVFRCYNELHQPPREPSSRLPRGVVGEMLLLAMLLAFCLIIAAALSRGLLSVAGIDLAPYAIVVGVVMIVGMVSLPVSPDNAHLLMPAAALAAATLGVLVYLAGNAIFARYIQLVFVPGAGELAVILSAVIGACMGSLWHSAPRPATQ